MYFYTKDGDKTEIKLGDYVNHGKSGEVYRLADIANECIKIYRTSKFGTNGVDDVILGIIKELKLKNYYEIYRLLYNETGDLAAHTMKYYPSADIDILAMPSEYTLNSLQNLYDSASILAANGIFTCDMHTGNVILGQNEIIVTDADKYFSVRTWDSTKLQAENVAALRYLFKSLFLSALKTYHPDIATLEVQKIIQGIFNLDNSLALERTCNKLSEYKYPIDYIKKKR